MLVLSQSAFPVLASFTLFDDSSRGKWPEDMLLTVDSMLLWFCFSEPGLDASPVMKNPAKLEGEATDGSFANKHGRHVIGHIDDYSALRQQIGEGTLLVKKIAAFVRSACTFPGLEAQGTEVITL